MNALIEGNIDLVFTCAKQHVASKPQCRLDWGDYVTSGYIGLTAAARTFSPSMGASFRTFARRRITGAMIDQERNENGRVNPNRKFNPRKPPKAASLDGLCADGSAMDRSDCLSVRPIDMVAGEDEVRAILKPLQPEQRCMARMKADGLTMKEIGQAFGISESRVSQQLVNARAVLKTNLEAA